MVKGLIWDMAEHAELLLFQKGFELVSIERAANPGKHRT